MQADTAVAVDVVVVLVTLPRFGGHLILWRPQRRETRMGRPAKYPEEFKREAVELYRSSDRPRVEVAKSLGISDGSLAAWVKDLEAREAPGALDAPGGRGGA